MEIYTDGACSGNPGRGSWGYVIIIDGLIYRHEHGPKFIQTTNNRMELSAVIEALKFLKNSVDRLYNETSIIIYSDSQYVIKSINEGWKRNKNLDLWAELDQYKLKHVTFEWVRGHNGNEWNELADKLAHRMIN